jgi:hypothetical protein
MNSAAPPTHLLNLSGPTYTLARLPLPACRPTDGYSQIPMPALATWAPEDGVLGAIAPLALATTQSTSLVVDLDSAGPHYPCARSLRELVEDGPRAADLSPDRTGVAVLANGGIAPEEARELVDLLLRGWPAVVLRLPPQAPGDVPAPIVPVRLLVPGRLFPPQGRGVYQPVAPGRGQRRRLEAGGSLILPTAPRKAIQALLEGSRPVANRWTRAWRRVWVASW